MLQPLYGCPQADFIVVAGTGYDSLEEYLADFTDFSPAYDQGWLDAARSELTVAAELPDEDARRATSELIRVDLAELNLKCCESWQRLKRYISKAFPENIVAIKLAAAGQNNYRAAANESWPYTKSLLISAANFMTANLTALTANNIMPPGFPAQMNALAALFNAKLSAYESAKEAIPVATELKVAALNKVFQRLMPMLLDGQEIFKNQEAIRQQFTYSVILSRVSGPGLAGIRGTITDKTTNDPIRNARIAFQDTDYLAITDENGEYELLCPSGKYTAVFSADGFNTHTETNVKVEVGTLSTIDLQMTPVDVPPAES
jgi:hypothetical protein